MSERCCAVVNRGMEAVCVAELLEHGCSDIQEEDGVVLFSVSDVQEVCVLCYTLQSVTRVLLLLSEFSDVFEVEKISFDSFIAKDTTFGVDYLKINDAEDARELVGALGEIVQQKTSAKVNLSQPDIPFLCVITKDANYFGIDFAGDDLGKRDYRIFLGHDALKGNVAFGLLEWAGVDSKKTLLDPFCRSGTIAIEAALFVTQRSPHFFSKNKFAFLKFWFLKDIEDIFARIDAQQKSVENKILCLDPSFQNVSAAKKNAKIAGVLDVLEFSRTDVEWLDIKFEQKSIDLVVTFPPQVSKLGDMKKLTKTYDWFFRQCASLLKKNGRIVLVSKQVSEKLLTEYANKYQFSLQGKHVFFQGSEELFALVFAQ